MKIFWRPPFGHVRPDTIAYLKKRGIHTVLWSSMPGDYRTAKPVDLPLNRALSRLQPGAIFVLHDGVTLRPAPVLDLTKSLVEEIHRRGWEAAPLTISDIMEQA